MSRSLNIFLWILVGALTTGIGMGTVLYRAAQDRSALAQQLQTQADETRQVTMRIADDANQKVAAAQDELQQAQAQTTQYKLMAQATTLTKPAPWQIKTWNQFLSLPAGVSVSVPVNMSATETVDGVVIGRDGYAPLVTIERSTPTLASTYQIEPNSTSTLLYIIDGKLFVGKRETIDDPAGPLTTDSLHEFGASSTYAIITKTLNPAATDHTVSQILATLSFQP